jgi:hypothetical protein
MSRSRLQAGSALKLRCCVNPNYRTPDLDFQPHRLHRASLSGAIALFELLSIELRSSDPDSSISLITKAAAQLLRRVQAGGVVIEVEWLEAFLQAQELFDSIRNVTQLFEPKKGAEPHEQTISWQNRRRGQRFSGC